MIEQTLKNVLILIPYSTPNLILHRKHDRHPLQLSAQTLPRMAMTQLLVAVLNSVDAHLSLHLVLGTDEHEMEDVLQRAITLRVLTRLGPDPLFVLRIQRDVPTPKCRDCFPIAPRHPFSIRFVRRRRVDVVFYEIS